MTKIDIKLNAIDIKYNAKKFKETNDSFIECPKCGMRLLSSNTGICWNGFNCDYIDEEQNYKEGRKW